ncbi:integral membrane protein 2C-like [Hemibagrus wyckioides]|uniref:integral membrane protein 2C-like n=1 Tax=Hemibagrus wyckioides TaxID=337641 RepID=UPI00266BFEAA|nr:integral membrane protein 2C-like [Hemibagrus wyckioides]
MVKISCAAINGVKAEKEEREGPERIYIPPQHVGVFRRSSLSGLCCLLIALIISTCSLVYASVYIYRYYIVPQANESQFRCNVYYEDNLKAPQHNREELQENVNINLQSNYERISINAGNTNPRTRPATIIHDFTKGLTAYHDITLDKCYISVLNNSVVLPPRNLWKLLINVKLRTGNEASFPQTYMVQEEMVVSEQVMNTRDFGVFIHRLCEGKPTYQIRRRLTRRRITKREEQICHSIRHFENTFVMDTLICDGHADL